MYLIRILKALNKITFFFLFLLFPDTFSPLELLNVSSGGFHFLTVFSWKSQRQWTLIEKELLTPLLLLLGLLN